MKTAYNKTQLEVDLDSPSDTNIEDMSIKYKKIKLLHKTLKFITNTDRIERNIKSQKTVGCNNNTKVISDLLKESANLPTMGNIL